jgi:hypothetical protein
MPEELTDDKAISQLFHELGWGGNVSVGDVPIADDSIDTELLDDYRSALGAYVLADTPVVEAPKNLRAKVVAAALNSDEKVTSFPVLPWLVAASFALMAGMSFLFWNDRSTELVTDNAALKEKVAASDLRVRELASEVEASDLRVRELASEVDQTFKAFIVWDDVRGAGVLKVENLPELGEDGDYQLWVVSEGYDKPLDGGVFDTHDGHAEMTIVTKELAATPARANAVTLFAISKERPGGVPVSETGQFVLTAAY